MTSIEKAGEFNLIRRLSSISSPRVHPPVLKGVGDDAAVYRSTPGMVQVISTDAFIEGHHFDYAFYTMEDIGYKAMAVNLSDIVAMNARPILATISVGLPGSFSIQNLELIYKGLAKIASDYGIQIVGGDTTRAPVLMLSITVIGEADESDIVYRSGASPGDYICVTGPLGDAAAGLDLLRNPQQAEALPSEVMKYLTDRHLKPIPRLDQVNEWAEEGVRPSAMIDISDGLSNELHHICTASGCGCLIWESNFPVSAELRTGIPDQSTLRNYVLNGGDDYELLFTASQEMLNLLNPEQFMKIGVITPEDLLLRSLGDSLVPLEIGGHDHFRVSSAD